MSGVLKQENDGEELQYIPFSIPDVKPEHLSPKKEESIDEKPPLGAQELGPSTSHNRMNGEFTERKHQMEELRQKVQQLVQSRPSQQSRHHPYISQNHLQAPQQPIQQLQSSQFNQLLNSPLLKQMLASKKPNLVQKKFQPQDQNQQQPQLQLEHRPKPMDTSGGIQQQQASQPLDQPRSEQSQLPGLQWIKGSDGHQYMLIQQRELWRQKQEKAIQQHVANLNLDEKKNYDTLNPTEKFQYFIQRGVMLPTPKGPKEYKIPISEEQRQSVESMDSEKLSLFIQIVQDEAQKHFQQGPSHGPTPNAQSQPRPQQGPIPNAQSHLRPQQCPTPNAQSQPRPQLGPNPNAQSQPRIQQGPIPNAQSQPRIQQGPIPNAQSQPRPQQGPNAQSQSRTQPEPNPDAHSQPSPHQGPTHDPQHPARTKQSSSSIPQSQLKPQQKTTPYLQCQPMPQQARTPYPYQQARPNQRPPLSTQRQPGPRQRPSPYPQYPPIPQYGPSPYPHYQPMPHQGPSPYPHYQPMPPHGPPPYPYYQPMPHHGPPPYPQYHPMPHHGPPPYPEYQPMPQQGPPPYPQPQPDPRQPVPHEEPAPDSQQQAPSDQSDDPNRLVTLVVQLPKEAQDIGGMKAFNVNVPLSSLKGPESHTKLTKMIMKSLSIAMKMPEIERKTALIEAQRNEQSQHHNFHHPLQQQQPQQQSQEQPPKEQPPSK